MKSSLAMKQQEFIRPGEGSNININSIKKKKVLKMESQGDLAEELNCLKQCKRGEN